MMSKHVRLLFLSALLAISSMMCSIIGVGDNSKIPEIERQATINSLQETVSTIQKNAVTPTVESTNALSFATMVRPPSGSISGNLSYPSEGLPPLRIVAINILTGEYFATEVTDHNQYGLDNLPEGKYHVLVYVVDPEGAGMNLVGGYSQFVLCGQTADCEDHNLVDVDVKGDTVTMNINPADWYAPPGTFPPDPLK